MQRHLHRRVPPLFVALALPYAPIISAQSTASLTRELTWSAPGNEIDSVRFSRDGKFIALVIRAHEADGEEAEGLPESYFTAIAERNRKEPRFADPVIKVIDLRDGKTVCEVAFGWNPSISPDNKRLAYSRQKKPITGFRLLAETQEGNDIQLFDCETKQSQLIAAPDKGYLDDPFFVEDGGALLYTQNEAVNGSFAGSVGIERFDLHQNRREILLSKKPIAAVPCPPKGNPQQTHDSIICSNAVNRTQEWYPLIFHFDSDYESLALLGTPIPALTDMYMTSRYDMNLLSLLPSPRVIFRFGTTELGRTDDLSFRLVSNHRALIFSDHWKLVSTATGAFLSDLGPKNRKRRSFYSPDMKYYLCPEPPEDSNHYVLYETKTGRVLKSFPPATAATGVTWSSDSRRFAMVIAPKAVRGLNYHEDLMVYAVP